jgi:hypothetical protein
MIVWRLTPLVIVSLLGCDSRFPVCRTEEDCKESRLGKHCYDLRCVGCRNDTDCEIGAVCGGDHTCESLGGPKGSAAPVSVEPTPETTETAVPKPKSTSTQNATSGKTPRDPVAWEACVKACDTKDCVSGCDAKFD